MIFSQRKWLFTLHWVQISFPLGILQSSATNPLLTIQDDLLDEAWPHLKVRRESGSGDLLLPRWSISGGVSADRNVILGQGRLSGLVSSWEWNFPWQHVVPFATGIHCCESSLLPCHEPWTRGYDLDNGMGLDFNGFRKPWQYHMKQWSMHVYRN